MKPIIIYCSHTGTTEKIAKRIARDLQCEMIKVEPDVLYGSFVQTVKRVIMDQRNGVVPGFVTEIPDLKDYDTVITGYPIWAGDVPGFMQEFLKQCDLAGKRIIPFATSKMTDIAASLDTLAAITGAEVLEPFFYGVLKRENYGAWLQAVKALPEPAECECAEADACECAEPAEAAEAPAAEAAAEETEAAGPAEE